MQSKESQPNGMIHDVHPSRIMQHLDRSRYRDRLPRWKQALQAAPLAWGAIGEVMAAIRDDPGQAWLHLLLSALYAGNADRHARWHMEWHATRATRLCPSDASCLRVAGDLLCGTGLEDNDRGRWRRGISLLRRAYRMQGARSLRQAA